MNRRSFLGGMLAALAAAPVMARPLIDANGNRVLARGGIVRGHVGYYIGDHHYGETIVPYNKIIGRALTSGKKGEVVIVQLGDHYGQPRRRDREPAHVRRDALARLTRRRPLDP